VWVPHDMLGGRQGEIHAARDRKLEEARRPRQFRRAAAAMLAESSNAATMPSPGETEVGSARMQPLGAVAKVAEDRLEESEVDSPKSLGEALRK
jgi:hypothetical protein